MVQTQNAAVTNTSNNETNIDGQYDYYMSAFYIKNEQTNSYDLYKETKRFDSIVNSGDYETIWLERVGIGQFADISNLVINVQTVGENKMIHYGDMDGTKLYSEFHDGEWVNIAYEYNNEFYEVGSWYGEKAQCDGETYEVIKRWTVDGDFEEDSFYYPLLGKDVMVKEIYKKK